MLRGILVSLALLMVLGSLLSTAGYRFLPSEKEPVTQTKSSQTTCVVIYVNDGDTVSCDFDGDGRSQGNLERVRLIGIDTPEMHYSPKNKTGKDAPLALESKQLVQQSTKGQTIYLEYDQEKFDKYDRRLAYVYLDPNKQTMLNELLLQKGYANTMFVGPNTRHRLRLIQAKEAAQANSQGIWSQRSH